MNVQIKKRKDGDIDIAFVRYGKTIALEVLTKEQAKSLADVLVAATNR